MYVRRFGWQTLKWGVGCKSAAVVYSQQDLSGSDMCSYLILCWFSEWLVVTRVWFPFFIIDSSLFLIILLTKFKIHEINWMHWEYKQLIPNYGSFKWLENTVKWGKIYSSRHLPNIQNEILEKQKCVFQRIAWQFVSFHLVVPFYNIPAFHI